MDVYAKSIKITPPVGLPIGGNVREDARARGVHDDLYCQAVYVRSGSNEYMFLSFDLLLLMQDQCDDIKERIHLTTGLSTSNIMVNATHTHSGPDTGEIFKEERIEESQAYLDNAFSKIAQSLADVRKKAVPANATMAKKDVFDLSFNRRLVMSDGTLAMNWTSVAPDEVIRTTGPIDPSLSVVSFTEEKTQKPLALMVNFTLHPAILVGQDWLYSRDYLHDMTIFLQTHFKEPIPVWFSNGAQGNINHIDYQNPNQKRGFFESERVGKKLAEHIIDALTNQRTLDDTMCSTQKIIELPLRSISKEMLQWAKDRWEECKGVIPSLLDGVPDELYAREIIKLAKANRKKIRTKIQAVSIGNALFVSFPGEVFTEFGLEVKAYASKYDTMIVGLANDYVGYIPDEKAFSEGGYEIKTAQSSQLSPQAGNRLVEQIKSMMNIWVK